MERVRSGRTTQPVSEPDADVVRRLYEAISRQDLEAVREIAHAEFEWNTTALFVGMRERYTGPDGAVKCVKDFTDLWAEMTIDVREIVELEDGVLAHVRYRARGRDDIAVDRGFGHQVIVEDGLVRRITSWADWDEARRAL